MNIEEQKLELERQRLEIEKIRTEIEKANAQNEKRIIYKHFGALLTALVTLATVGVSASQIWVAKITHDREIEISQIQREKEHDLAQLEMDRRWKLDITNFVAKNQDLIFSKDTEQRKTIRNVLLVTFPPDVTKALFERLERAVSDEEQETWREGRNIIAQLQGVRVSLQYNSEKNETLVNQLAQLLRKNGYYISNVWVNRNQTKGDVRYFNPSDKSTGKDIENIVEQFLESNGITMDIALLYPKQYEGKVRPGTIEIWLPEIPEKN